MRERVQSGVLSNPAGQEGLRSEQFPAGRPAPTPEQVAHLARVLGGARLEDDGPGPEPDDPPEGVVHPDGRDRLD